MKKFFNYKSITVVQLCISVLFIFSLLQLNLLPISYILGLITFLLIIHFWLFNGNKKDNKFTIAVSILLSFFLLFSLPFINKGKNAIDMITEVSGEINRVVLIVKKESVYQNIDDLDNMVVQINTKYNGTLN